MIFGCTWCSAAETRHDDRRACRNTLAGFSQIAGRCRQALRQASKHRRHQHAEYDDQKQSAKRLDLGNVVDQCEPGRTDEYSRDEKSGDRSEARRAKQGYGKHGGRQQDNDVQEIIGHHCAAIIVGSPLQR